MVPGRFDSGPLHLFKIMRAQCKTDRCPQGRNGDPAAYRQAVILIALSEKPSCRDYDEDCEDMTLEQINACHANPGANDDYCGACVMKRRCN